MSYQHGEIRIEAGPSQPRADAEQGYPTISSPTRFESALPLRLDMAAALTYALGPITGIGFLMKEWKNDYVRFHAWQSCLASLPLLFLHMFFILVGAGSGWQWFLFCVDVLLAGWCAYKAYTNGESLVRYELPFFGPIASRWTDAELEIVLT